MAETYTIDSAHSSVQFSVRHLMLSNVRGTFGGVKGTIVHDSANPANASIQAEIDVNSLNTNDEKRDGHLKSPDFFDFEKYPTIQFVSKKVEKTGENEFKASGDLTLHGVTKEAVLTIDEVSPEGKDLTWSAPLETGGVVIGDDVKLEFDIEAVKAQSSAA